MALFRLYKKQWESGFRPIRKVAQPRSRNKADGNAASTANALTPRSPSSTSPPGRKRKRSDSSEVGDDDVDGVAEASSPSSWGRTHSSSPSSAPRTKSLTQHTSTLPRRHKQRSRPQPPPDSSQRKGISSGVFTVTKRAGGKKEVRRRSEGNIVWNGAKGEKKTDKGGEKWWKTLAGGKKSIKL